MMTTVIYPQTDVEIKVNRLPEPTSDDDDSNLPINCVIVIALS
jgi:hypothetical protein